MKANCTRVLPLLALLGLAYAPARAQVFEPGYLVLSRGDTLRGEVENAFWSDPPSTLRFRAGADAPIRSYRRAQLRAVQLGSGRLLRQELLPIDYYAETRVDYLSQGLVVRQQPDSLLADVLVEGSASLLGVRWKGIQHFFVRRPGQPYLELSERRYLLNRQIKDGNNYRAQLEMYFGDCAPAVAALQRARYTTEDVAGVVQAYNQECSAERQPGRRIEATEATPDRVKVQIGPLLGVRYNSMRLRTTDRPGQEPRTLNGLQLDGRAHALGGLYFDVVEGGRRLALHTAVFGSRFGRTVAVASPTGSAQWAGTLDWRGFSATLQLGLRGLTTVGSDYQLFIGSGVELPMYWADDIRLRYGTGTRSRPIADRLDLPTNTSFNVGFGSTLLPYLEVGVRRNRLSATLYGRFYSEESYYDHMVVANLTDQNGYFNSSGYDYQARTVSLAFMLGYQLNANTDKRR